MYLSLITKFDILLLLLLAFVSHIHAHGDHSHDQVPLAGDANWATRHMAEEHHLSSFDAGVFFTLHDYDNTGSWSPTDILRTYGLYDDSSKHIPTSKHDEVTEKILSLYDDDHSGTVSYAEFIAADARGVELPDFGLGPGHHGDDEYEYEIHHFEKYHGGDDVKEEDLIHPEDIAHFAKHEREELEAMELEEREAVGRESGGVVESNIPMKFRKGA